MKKELKLIVLVVIFSVLVPLNIFASEGHGRDIDIVIGEILEKSQSEDLSEISIKEVSPELLEELGDVVMGLMLNDDWHHERMDAMLGGEGSYQLAAYHRDLGEQYIISGGDLDRIYFSGGGRMMLGGVMGVKGFSRFSPFDTRWNRFNYRNDWSWVIPLILVGIAIMVITAILLIRKKGQKSGNQALIILQNRFARGEISQQEYKKMEKIIRN